MAGQKLFAQCVLSAALFGGMAAAIAPPKVAHAQTVLWKQCSRCNRTVPITSRVGQDCPYCGAYWGSEQTQYVPGGGTSGRPLPGNGPTIYLPRPRNSLERMALYQALARSQMILQQVTRQQMIQQERELRRQRRAEWAQKQREEEKARREKTYARLRAAPERASGHDNP